MNLGAQPQLSSGGPAGNGRLLDAAGLSVERLPMLNVVFDRMISLCSDSFRLLSGTPARLSLSAIGTGRIGAILDSFEGRTLASVYQAAEWDSRILLGLDRDFIFTLLEVVLGGDGNETRPSEDRPLSNVETRLASMMFETAANALQTAFASVSALSLRHDRIESRMEFAAVGRRNSLAVIVRARLEAVGLSGEMFVLIPQSALNPIRQTLARDITSVAPASDPRWKSQIEREVNRTEVRLVGLIEEPRMTLGQIAELRVGAILPLQSGPDSVVRLQCNDQLLFWCHLGQADGHYSLRVERAHDPDQEFVDGLFAG